MFVKTEVKEKSPGRSILRLAIRIVYCFLKGRKSMTKRELIDHICAINKSARPDFLARFLEEQLEAYLEHLMQLELEEVVLCC